MAPLEYLITGATGVLGSAVLEYFLSHGIPISSIAVASSQASAEPDFRARGLQFRLVDYSLPETLELAFKNVENLYFVSSAAYDTETRVKQHGNVAEAAKKMEVKHVSF